MRRGFTLIELSFVVAIIAVLAAVTVPAYQSVLRRARADEARSMLSVIAHNQLRHHRDRGGYLACPAEGDVPRTPRAFPNASECWKALGVQVDGPMRYRYSVALDGDSFTAIAEGDLDADGVSSHYALAGRDLNLTVRDALE